MDPKIRGLEKGDIESVYKIGIKVLEFKGFWPIETLEKFVEQDLSLVVEDAHKIVGFLLAVYQPITGKLTWENMHLNQDYRGRGIVDNCFNEAWRRAKDRGANYVEAFIDGDNVSAQKMCERLGLEVIGTCQWRMKRD